MPRLGWITGQAWGWRGNRGIIWFNHALWDAKDFGLPCQILQPDWGEPYCWRWGWSWKVLSDLKNPLSNCNSTSCLQVPGHAWKDESFLISQMEKALKLVIGSQAPLACASQPRGGLSLRHRDWQDQVRQSSCLLAAHHKGASQACVRQGCGTSQSPVLVHRAGRRSWSTEDLIFAFAEVCQGCLASVEICILRSQAEPWAGHQVDLLW